MINCQVFKRITICRIILWLAGSALSYSPVVAGELEEQKINTVKAAFVLNVARFVTWPEEVFEAIEDPLLLCFYRTNPFGDALDSIRGKAVAGRDLEITRVESLAKSGSCQVMLISQADLNAYLDEAHPTLTHWLLTITDRTEMSSEPVKETGILVTLVREGSRIKFEIDLKATHAAGLKMSSELLKHARIVGEGS